MHSKTITPATLRAQLRDHDVAVSQALQALVYAVSDLSDQVQHGQRLRQQLAAVLLVTRAVPHVQHRDRTQTSAGGLA